MKFGILMMAGVVVFNASAEAQNRAQSQGGQGRTVSGHVLIGALEDSVEVSEGQEGTGQGRELCFLEKVPTRDERLIVRLRSGRSQVVLAVDKRDRLRKRSTGTSATVTETYTGRDYRVAFQTFEDISSFNVKIETRQGTMFCAFSE